MKGTYRFYQDGVLISETNNLITTQGKRQVIKFFAGYVNSIAKAIAVGLGNTAANVSDTALEFEWSRTDIVNISADYLNTSVVFKGQIPAEVSGKVYEVGLWSEMDIGQMFNSRLLLTFDQGGESWTTPTGVTWQTSTNRIGADNLRLAPAVSTSASSSLTNVQLDLSGYSDLDEFALAYNVNSAFVSNVEVIMYTDASNYYTYTINTPAAGYDVRPFSKAAFVTTGTPTWSNITYVDVSVTSTGGGSGSVDFDGLRIEDKDYDSEEYILFSRAIPTVPVVKLAGHPLDFEYLLDLTL